MSARSLPIARCADTLLLAAHRRRVTGGLAWLGFVSGTLMTRDNECAPEVGHLAMHAGVLPMAPVAAPRAGCLVPARRLPTSWPLVSIRHADPRR